MYKYAEFVKNERKKVKMSQAQLAAAANINQAAISRFETGLTILPADVFELVVNVLGYQFDITPLPGSDQSPTDGIQGG